MGMAVPTVTDSRIGALVPRIEALDGEAARREAVALGLVDALLEADEEALAAALPALRDARARDGDEGLLGWLDAAIAFTHWGLERLSSPAGVAEGTQAHDFLRALDGSAPLGSTEVRRLLEIDETQVSRAGRRLLERGLVTRRKIGREVFWQLTPRGRRALEEAPAPQRSSASGFWQEALRRGFEKASGDQPGPPRAVDPTREQIVESTLELHLSRGIQATTWEQVADKSGVPLETVKELFATRDELVRSCGAHVMESLQLPPVDRAPDVFAGAANETERIRRLVETSFGAYERGGDGIAVGRRERRELPVVDESLTALDQSLDALVAEALRPQKLDSSSIASVRALTDLEVWRTLRDQGATPAAAVDEASTTVERWLEAQGA
jgi:DNA-binding MarR family transcriptional regulator